MNDYIDDGCLGYKAPFYKMSIETYKALIMEGFSWLESWWSIIPITPILRPMPPFYVIPSHTGNELQNNPDNIDKIFDRIDQQLTDAEANQEVNYVTAVEIIKGITQ